MSDTYHDVPDREFYSQFGEDRILIDIFSDVPNGLCIEVGANDGINDSTSFHFEKKGWRCILIEPNPDLCKTIRAHRNSELVECAASDKAGETTLYVASGSERAHGVSTVIQSEDALKRIGSFGFTYTSVKVETQTLDQILNLQKIDRPIDFLTIDVEGHELAVLKGFDIEKWHPTIIILEDNSNYEDAAVRNHLNGFDYVPFRRTGVNEWYAHKDNSTLINVSSLVSYHYARVKAVWIRHLKAVPGLLRLKRYLLR